MSNTDYAHPEYVLGHSESELDRLIRQSALFGDLTAHTLGLAGLRPGMHVLDVGCGAGDVSLLAASMVGAAGSVIGVDQNGDALAAARSRVAAAGLTNVAFEQGDVTAMPYRGHFDAVIGRLVVLYLGDPVAGVKAFASYAKPGGLVFFQEFCQPRTASIPDVELFAEAIRVINETFARAKIELYTGMHLPRIYRDAGLPAPRMLAMSRVEAGPDSGIYAYIAQTLRSLLPLAARTGVTTAAALDLDTFEARFREEAVAKHAVMHLPELIAAWTRVPA